MLPLLLSEWTVCIAGNVCSKDLDKQYTLDILFLFCTALFFIYLSLLQIFFLPCVVYKTKMPLTVFHCHTVLIENVWRLLCKSMFPRVYIKMCVKLKHILWGSNVELQKLTWNVNAALWSTYIMSKISLKFCRSSPWISFKFLGFRLRKNFSTL